MISELLPCIFELFVGILLLINPASFTSGIIIVGGFVLLIVGIRNTAAYFRHDPDTAALSQQLFRGLLYLSGGLFCIFSSKRLLAAFSALTVLYGLAIFVFSLYKTQRAVDLFRKKNGRWSLPAVSAALSFIFALIILKNPFASTHALWNFTGIILIVEAIVDGAAYFATYSTKRKQ